ncbi:MAG: UDP-N-acetylmuramoyl-L-alanyl-D-glutamate--2,6-diaminopimelate ligase [Opitutaceae bacterium]|jgi:UDP-N-acetylmuramoyl-L-alanyl-D-glutamate--2,6-diaminopimelate ligase|nr:UDP-N-acetylmuramoyl-L-alanyl-D-glutamate--2,6-diaminopimelate ligase [Opitutaceae bacterium]
MIGYLTRDHALVNAFRSFAGAPAPAAPRGRARRKPATAEERIFNMAPKLSDYFGDGEIIDSKGALDRPISGLVMDSRRVVPGNLFFALPGLRADGSGFIDEAVTRGAVAVVTAKLPVHAPAKVTFIQVADPRAQLARVAQRYYRFPDRDLSVVGVTGTNGKTTVSHLVKHLLDGGARVGLIGTIHYDLGARTVPSFKTTPESVDIYGMLAQMRDAGCRQAVMEVSSHGIDQRRVLGLGFSAAVFTNLTRDHLDYHQTLEAYFAVKTRLFTGATGAAPRLAIINLDDPHGEKLAALIPAGARAVTFGENPRAQIRAEDVSLHFKNTTFRLVWPGGAMPVESPLIGRYNVSNLLAAVATAWALGRDPVVFLPRLKTFPGVAGRMERIEAGQPFNVLVDYAHTDDALRNALGMLRAITPGRLLVVFGCGGNRDRAKRPLMVRAVQEQADFAFATADNPRGETLAQIFADMKTGVTAPDKITWIEDRRRAIGHALDIAQPGDCLLVAGKGHESYQEFADTVIPFDDRQTVRELIAVKTLKN